MPTTVLTNHAPRRRGYPKMVMIGVDPDKGSHTAVAIGKEEHSLGELRVRSGPKQVERLLKWAAAFPERTYSGGSR